MDFNSIPVTIIPNLKGGEKEVSVRMFSDDLNKIMKLRLIPGASIGLHTHDSSSEILMIISGRGSVLFDGVLIPVTEGDVHYCPKGHSHSIINDSDSDLTVFAVVPQQ